MTARAQFGLISLGAAGLLAALQFAAPAPALSHLDFIPGGLGALEYCDPRTPRAVELSRTPPATLSVEDRQGRLVLELRTATGKPIGPSDLIFPHRLSLRVFGPAPTVQTVFPEPGDRPGQWLVPLPSGGSGELRFTATFTPTATGAPIEAQGDWKAPHPPRPP